MLIAGKLADIAVGIFLIQRIDVKMLSYITAVVLHPSAACSCYAACLLAVLSFELALLSACFGLNAICAGLILTVERLLELRLCLHITGLSRLGRSIKAKLRPQRIHRLFVLACAKSERICGFALSALESILIFALLCLRLVILLLIQIIGIVHIKLLPQLIEGSVLCTKLSCLARLALALE